MFGPNWTKGTWTHPKRKRKLKGWWSYVWQSDRFLIDLGPKGYRVCDGDAPEWNGWKLERENEERPQPQENYAKDNYMV